MRYQSAAELKENLLDRQRELELGSGGAVIAEGSARKPRTAWIAVTGAIALLLVATLAFFLARRAGSAGKTFSCSTSLAVLPFRNASGDTQLDYLSTALPDEIVTTLTYAPTLNVRPFSMSQSLPGRNADPRLLACIWFSSCAACAS